MRKKFQKKHYLADPYDVDEFKKFISDNININIKNPVFEKELKCFFDYYYRFFDKEEWISIRDMLHLYMWTIDTKILYVQRDDILNHPKEIDDYREEYKKMNTNVFENIKKIYSYNLENWIIDEDIQIRFFYISLIDVIWTYICIKINEAEWKKKISLYWDDFFSFLKKNIHRINSQTHGCLWYGI